MARLKPDATCGSTLVRLKPDATCGSTLVRLKPDATCGSTLVRLKPDTAGGATYSTQSAMNTFVSPSPFARRFDAKTICLPSGENIGNPSNVLL